MSIGLLLAILIYTYLSYRAYKFYFSDEDDTFIMFEAVMWVAANAIILADTLIILSIF